MSKRLRIGKIPFLNLYPIFHVLEKSLDRNTYEIIEGHPSELNAMLRAGSIDISPSSSVVYLKDKERFRFIEGHGICSSKKIRSILLISRHPIDRLGGSVVALTGSSETSVSLLDVLLRKLYKVEYTPVVSTYGDFLQNNNFGAYLSIGDEALVISGTMDGSLYVYDLAELWHMHTGLPFVFALWIYMKDASPGTLESINMLRHALDGARNTAINSLKDISVAGKLVLSPEDALTYWADMSYDLTPECIEGLMMFDRLLAR